MLLKRKRFSAGYLRSGAPKFGRPVVTRDSIQVIKERTFVSVGLYLLRVVV
jgi:hypothetical protein